MGRGSTHGSIAHAYVHTALLCACIIVCGENSVGTNPRKRPRSPPPPLASKQQQESDGGADAGQSNSPSYDSGKATPNSSASNANRINSAPSLHGNGFHSNETTPHSNEGAGVLLDAALSSRYLEHPAYIITMEEEEEETITRGTEVVKIEPLLEGVPPRRWNPWGFSHPLFTC